jgi:[acyl-carrier-protein] S-malonyltransferase
MTRALIFPGQGSQAVGMGKELALAFGTARDVFAEIDEALKQNLSRLMFEGPDSDLTLTENAQPALMAVSLAVARVLEKDGGLNWKRHVAFVAGHSLGEYSALAAAHALDLADAARLLKRRGLAMQRAVPVGVGAMAALLGMEIDAARDVAQAAAQGEVCDTANDNGPGQVVVSGHRTAVERAIAIAAERGARRSILLPVSAPFHCALMKPAADEMAEALGAVKLLAPIVPLVANVSASPIQDPEEIKHLLVEQVTGLVRWRECVLALKEHGVHELVEVGAGRVLSSLAKRIDRELSTTAIGAPADVDAFIKTI